MGKKCCVFGCKTGYSSEKVAERDKKISVFRFPTDEGERKAWISAIPNANLTVTNDTVVCELHWPSDFETVTKKGRRRPKHPPSVWPNVPTSQIPTPAPPPRSRKKILFSHRSVEVDQLAEFLKQDALTYADLRDTLVGNKKDFHQPIIAYCDDEALVVQSKKFCSRVPNFVIRISPDLTFENFHNGIKCAASSLSKNRITSFKTWSAFEENVRFLSCLEPDNKKKVIQQQLQAMGTSVVGKSVYSPDIIIRAFENFTTSRSLYQRLRIDFQLPSVQTLTRITSKVAKLDEVTFSKAVFENLEDRQKICVLQQDEVYVKKMMLYHGGQVFGRSVDNPQCLAKTVLGIMVSCMFGGPTFLSKVLPVHRLNSNFLQDQLQLSMECIEASGGTVKAIVCDGNRTNQALFKSFPTEPKHPWHTHPGLYLLFDYVHLLKNIRNSWLTETTGELEFYDNGIKRTAKWSHLQELQKLENGCLVKMSDLTEVAVSPKAIERQKVSTCLRVFSEKTYQALVNHSGMEKFQGVEDTAVFINKVITWWKILNVRSAFKDTRLRDELQAVIRNPADGRLDTILEFGEMALQMAGRQGKRVKQLTKDTAQAIHHTCNGVVALCRELLLTSHEYVMLGLFSTDPLEKQFSKLRQGSGGTYFINVQQILEKTSIHKAKLLLTLSTDQTQLQAEEA